MPTSEARRRSRKGYRSDGVPCHYYPHTHTFINMITLIFDTDSFLVKCLFVACGAHTWAIKRQMRKEKMCWSISQPEALRCDEWVSVYECEKPLKIRRLIKLFWSSVPYLGEVMAEKWNTSRSTGIAVETHGGRLPDNDKKSACTEWMCVTVSIQGGKRRGKIFNNDLFYF